MTSFTFFVSRFRNVIHHQYVHSLEIVNKRQLTNTIFLKSYPNCKNKRRQISKWRQFNGYYLATVRPTHRYKQLIKRCFAICVY